MDNATWIQENKGILEIAFVVSIFLILIVGLLWYMSKTMAKQQRKRKAAREAQKYSTRNQESQNQGQEQTEAK